MVRFSVPLQLVNLLVYFFGSILYALQSCLGTVQCIVSCAPSTLQRPAQQVPSHLLASSCSDTIAFGNASMKCLIVRAVSRSSEFWES